MYIYSEGILFPITFYPFTRVKHYEKKKRRQYYTRIYSRIIIIIYCVMIFIVSSETIDLLAVSE